LEDRLRSDANRIAFLQYTTYLASEFESSASSLTTVPDDNSPSPPARPGYASLPVLALASPDNSSGPRASISPPSRVGQKLIINVQSKAGHLDFLTPAAAHDSSAPLDSGPFSIKPLDLTEFDPICQEASKAVSKTSERSGMGPCLDTVGDESPGVYMLTSLPCFPSLPAEAVHLVASSEASFVAKIEGMLLPLPKTPTDRSVPPIVQGPPAVIKRTS
jgi:hypothetical protein